MTATATPPPFPTTVSSRRGMWHDPMDDVSNETVIDDLSRLIGREQVLHRLIERTAKAGDASIYRLTPRVVVLPRNEDDVRAVLAYCRRVGLHLTFRAAGTSLSGQAVTDGVLVDVSRHWKGLRVLDGGRRVAAQPGVVAAHVNAYLAPHRAKIGPDPASIASCMMGGVAANNASGMCCGVKHNSYHTMESLKLILADGWTCDTSDPRADARLAAERPAVHRGLANLRDRLRADTALAARVRAKFAIKNTCGYGMNALVDHDQPIDILSHLLIGSEGTLGFISEITLATLPDKPLKATALVYFRDLRDVGAVVPPLVAIGVDVTEIMDRNSMASVEDEMDYPVRLSPRPPAPGDVRPAAPPNCGALLVELHDDDEASLASRIAAATAALAAHPLLAPPEFTREAATQAHYWHMRKGLFPSVGAMRELGTAVIIEDIAVPPRHLSDAIAEVQRLCAAHGFPDAIIFGHAKDGNIHFVLCTDFADDAQTVRYAALMDELTDTIVRRYDGSLKAEHGTGRNIAPFVELEWGPVLYEMMWEVKGLLDPDGILNPGVVLNRDPRVHLKDLKSMAAVDPIIDKCIECGFCEPKCPSRDLTTTPRSRIAVLREMARLEASDEPGARRDAATLRREFQYYGDDTCAADGMCATACPVKINTGEMVKSLRARGTSGFSRGVATALARRFGLLAAGARAGLAAVNATGAFGHAAAIAGSGLLHRITGGAAPRLPAEMPLPEAAPDLPRRAMARTAGTDGADQRPVVVYFPTCLTRSLGRLPEENSATGLAEAVVSVLDAVGFDAVIPAGIGSLCCGQPFYSKGYNEAGVTSATETVNALWAATAEGLHPVVCDTSPCSGQFAEGPKHLAGETLRRLKAMRILDFPTFMAHDVLPNPPDGGWPVLDRHAVLHPTCTTMKSGATGDLRAVASAFARLVTIPVAAECCGFAGDRGFNVPELTLSATRPEAAELAARRADAEGCETRCYSTCRTCEIGMTAGIGDTYAGIVHLCYDALVAGAGGAGRTRRPGVWES